MEEDEDFPICQYCNGSGEGYASDTKCMTCKGRGVIKPEPEYDDDLVYERWKQDLRDREEEECQSS